MLRKLTEENMSLLDVYAKILTTCSNKQAQRFLITRIYKILSKTMKARTKADFPQTSFDLQVVNLVSYIKEDKLAYAFLYVSSLYDLITQNTTKNDFKSSKGTMSHWGKIKAYFGF